MSNINYEIIIGKGRSLAYNKTAPTKPTKAPRPTLAAEPSD